MKNILEVHGRIRASSESVITGRVSPSLPHWTVGLRPWITKMRVCHSNNRFLFAISFLTNRYGIYSRDDVDDDVDCV